MEMRQRQDYDAPVILRRENATIPPVCPLQPSAALRSRGIDDRDSGSTASSSGRWWAWDRKLDAYVGDPALAAILKTILVSLLPMVFAFLVRTPDSPPTRLRSGISSSTFAKLFATSFEPWRREPALPPVVCTALSVGRVYVIYRIGHFWKVWTGP